MTWLLLIFLASGSIEVYSIPDLQTCVVQSRVILINTDATSASCRPWSGITA